MILSLHPVCVKLLGNNPKVWYSYDVTVDLETVHQQK